MYPLLDDSLIRKDKSLDKALFLGESRAILFKYSMMASLYMLLFGMITVLIFLPAWKDYFLSNEVFTLYAILIVALAMGATAWYTCFDIVKKLLGQADYITIGIGYFIQIWLAGFVGYVLTFFLLNEATNILALKLPSLLLLFFIGLVLSIIAGPIVLYLSKDKIEKTFEIDQ